MVSHKPDIVKTIRTEGIELTRAGDCYKGLCPWHDDKDPSFVVWPGSQMFRCFGKCNVSGDVITFIKHHKDYSFKQACRYLRVTPGKTRQEILENEFLNTFECLIKGTFEATGKMPTAKDFAEYSLVMLPQMLEWIACEIVERQERKKWGGTAKQTGASKDEHKYIKVNFS